MHKDSRLFTHCHPQTRALDALAAGQKVKSQNGAERQKTKAGVVEGQEADFGKGSGRRGWGERGLREDGVLTGRWYLCFSPGPRASPQCMSSRPTVYLVSVQRRPSLGCLAQRRKRDFTGVGPWSQAAGDWRLVESSTQVLRLQRVHCLKGILDTAGRPCGGPIDP